MEHLLGRLLREVKSITRDLFVLPLYIQGPYKDRAKKVLAVKWTGDAATSCFNQRRERHHQLHNDPNKGTVHISRPTLRQAHSLHRHAETDTTGTGRHGFRGRGLINATSSNKNEAHRNDPSWHDQNSLQPQAIPQPQKWTRTRQRPRRKHLCECTTCTISYIDPIRVCG